MNPLTFHACIFSGVICNACGVAIDNANMRPSRLDRHRNSTHPDMALDAKHQLERANETMNDVAKCLSAFGTHGGKAQVCETFLTRANVMWCAHASCCRAYEDYHQHSGRNRAEHRESGHFTDKIMKCPKLPKSTKILSWTPGIWWML